MTAWATLDKPVEKCRPGDEPGSLTLTKPRRFDPGLVFNQREVATSPGSTAASPIPAAPPAPSASVAPGDGRWHQVQPGETEA